MLVAILGPRYDGLGQPELHAGEIERVGLAVGEDDVQDLVLLVGGRLTVLAGEAAAVEGLEGKREFADFGAEVWRLRKVTWWMC